MQRFLKTKKTAQNAVFLSVNQSWWSIKDVKVTFGNLPERDIEEIRELLVTDGNQLA